MAVASLTDARIWIDGYDLASTTNQVGIDATRAEIDVTNFDSAGWTERIGGRKSSTLTVNGFLDYATGKSAEAFDATFGNTDKVVSVAVDDAAGSTAFFGKAFHGELTRLGGSPGTDAAMANATFMTSSAAGLVEGLILVGKTTSSGGGSSTGIQVGAVGSGEKVYGALHVFSATGTLTITVVSDDNSNFTSATSRLSFTATSSVGAEWKEAAGPITDDYWRANISLPSGTATWALVLGIQ